jgi:hypothetical protein
MGGSSYSDDFYHSRAADKKARGVDTFAHNAAISSGAVAAKVHDRLNPKGVTRESRDSDAHPESLAIGVMFDVTGSMGGVPRILQKKLPQLMGLLLRKGYVEHPQILMGAIGDAISDRGSLQVGQFESGIEMDEDLERFWLEGGGGGSQQESYQNAVYFFARHTSIDCFEKRGKKGYLFLTGDEAPYPTVRAAEVAHLIGDSLQADIPTAQIIAEARERYHVFFVIPQGASYSREAWLKRTWVDLLGAENVLETDPEAISECVALAIGICEGTVDLASGAAHIKDSGASASIVNSVSRALDPLASKHALARSGTGDLPARTGPSSTNVRI